jgi:hypothetical protein
MSISQNFPILAPTLTHDFVKTKRMDPRITFTRSSSATYFNSSGVLTTAANNEPRFDHDPATLSSRGFLPEEQRTNSIRNNTMVGAVAGTPGTIPTNWGSPGAGSGLTQQVVGTGTENGITYLDLKVSGTPSSSGVFDITIESATQVAASNGQSWTHSSYVKLAAGAATNAVFSVLVLGRDSGGALVAGQVGQTVFVPTTAGLTTQRPVATFAMSSASVAYAQPRIRIEYTSGNAIDITLRIGLPQLEQGKFVTSVIRTTGAAVTRSQDFADMTGANFNSWFNPNEFTIVVQARRNYSGNFLTYPNLYRITDAIGFGSSNNSVAMYGAEASTQLTNFSVLSANTNQTDFVFRTISDTSTFKAIQGLRANNSTFGVNGSLTTTDTSVVMPIGLNRMIIGYDGGGSPWNGYVERISYYPVLVTNAQLQALTL